MGGSLCTKATREPYSVTFHVGKTSRYLHMRISDHMKKSRPLLGKKRKNPPPTGILSHHLVTAHPTSYNFKISLKLASSSEFELHLRESILTAKTKSSLNVNIGSAPFCLF